MIRMKCLKVLKYAGRYLRVGEEFDVKGEGDARLLKAIGKAERIVAVPIASAFVAKPVRAKITEAPTRSYVAEIELPEFAPAVDVEPSQEVAEIDDLGPVEQIENEPVDSVQVEPEEKPKRQYRRRESANKK